MADEENVDVAPEVAETEEPAAVEEAAPEEPEAAAEEEVEAEPAPAKEVKSGDASGVFAKREGVLSVGDASDMLNEFIAMIENHYVDSGETVGECQIWFKLILDKKGRKFVVMDSGERGTDFKSLVGALDNKISLFCVCCRSWDEDNVKPRIVKCAFRWSPTTGVPVKMRTGYNSMISFESGMKMGTSVSAQIAEDRDDDWPSKALIQSFLKNIKKNAGSHSRNNYCFGHEEVLE